MQLTKEQTIAAHEQQLAEAKVEVANAKELERLLNTPVFKKVILERFCVTECARYAQMSADPSLTAEQRADALGIAQAAGHLRRWIGVVLRMADTHSASIPNLEDNIEIMRQQSDEEFADGVEMQ